MSTVFWQLAIAGEAGFPYFTAVYVVGFIAAVGIGSLAWYNSKRPPGWEGQERPGFIPKVKNPEDEGSEG
jgi:hypothetical protein